MNTTSGMLVLFLSVLPLGANMGCGGDSAEGETARVEKSGVTFEHPEVGLLRPWGSTQNDYVYSTATLISSNVIMANTTSVPPGLGMIEPAKRGDFTIYHQDGTSYSYGLEEFKPVSGKEGAIEITLFRLSKMVDPGI